MKRLFALAALLIVLVSCASRKPNSNSNGVIVDFKTENPKNGMYRYSLYPINERSRRFWYESMENFKEHDTLYLVSKSKIK